MNDKYTNIIEPVIRNPTRDLVSTYRDEIRRIKPFMQQFRQIIETLNANSEYIIQIVPQITFEDGFIINQTENALNMHILTRDNSLIGTARVTFSFDPKQDMVIGSLNFIQGIRNNKFVKDNHWFYAVIEHIIKGLIPIYHASHSNNSIIFGGLIELKEKIKRLEENLEKGNRYIRENPSHALKHVRKDIALTLMRTLPVYEFYSKLRDRFFDKEGHINPNKKRIAPHFAYKSRLRINLIPQIRRIKKGI